MTGYEIEYLLHALKDLYEKTIDIPLNGDKKECEYPFDDLNRIMT